MVIVLWDQVEYITSFLLQSDIYCALFKREVIQKIAYLSSWSEVRRMMLSYHMDKHVNQDAMKSQDIQEQQKEVPSRHGLFTHGFRVWIAVRYSVSYMCQATTLCIRHTRHISIDLLKTDCWK